MAQENTVVNLPSGQMKKVTKDYVNTCIPLFKQALTVIIKSELDAAQKEKQANAVIDSMVNFLSQTDELALSLGD